VGNSSHPNDTNSRHPTTQTKQSRCRPTSHSAPSRSLRVRRSRTAPSPSGFASGPTTPSGTTPSDDTGARPVSVSKRLASIPHPSLDSRFSIASLHYFKPL
ncbi:hypothetical protein IAQ61_012033, partial [Plenodomus lingam]|uniref:60S ribosomal protein eL39 n=1 Tax=Leptosphaeria maculans TaxID=5022 RepID=UPI0033314250